MGIEYVGQQNKKGQQKGTNFYKPASYYFDNKHAISSHKLKEKLIKDGIKENKCEICGYSMWQGVKLPLELHHKDQNHFNNNFDNLQILCPNCHSIQEGNSGANVGKHAVVQELEDYSQLECEAKSVGVRVPVTALKHYCTSCGMEIHSSKSGLCRECSHIKQRVVERPSREELKEAIRTKTFLELGRLYEVSDNAVRKWCKLENLPFKKTEIKAYSDEEWLKI